MAIPSWLQKTASEVEEVKDEKGPSVNFMDDTYKKLLDMYKGGKLDDWASQIMEEVECLRDVMNTAISQVNQKLEPMAKTAAPKTKEKPFDFGDARLKEDVTPREEKEDAEEAEEDGDDEKTILPGTVNRKLPPKMKEPETTKWKEIRFNKRTGTWQVVVTIRHTRNFLSEDEAVDFTKQASQG